MANNKLVSVIVVNYKGGELLKECIQSIIDQTYCPIEIILVDNGSEDGLADISKLFPSVRIIKLQDNKGFTGGNIEGLKYAKGDYVFLANNDVVLDRNCIFNLINSMENYSQVGIGATKMLVYGTNIIDSAGDGFSPVLKAFKRGEGLSADNFNKEEFVFSACAGAAMYRRKMIDEIGFFDDDFFLIFEDVDLSFRAQLRGWRVLYIPSSVVYHRVRSTIGILSDIAVYYSLRNCELVRIKNVPAGIFFKYLPFLFFGELLDFLYFVLKHRKAKLYLKAKIDALKLAPSMLKKRKVIMDTKKVTNGYFKNFITPLFDRNFFITKIKKFFDAKK